ncbi:MAG: hypothetical protein K8R85_12590 [Bacteroidetes bacterium]|nr:hypothetical protein [Bacteroidota bacterium]
MKKIITTIILLLTLIISPTNRMNAQTNDWQPIYLLVTGANTMEGVEAFFQLNTCNAEDIIYVKFINHNEYLVQLEWFDAVFTQELKWINKEEAGDKKSITLAANAEAKGTCLNNAYPELIIKVKDFVDGKKDVKRYSSSQLMIMMPLKEH